MKKIKRTTVLLAVLALVFILASCTESDSEQGANNPNGGAFTLEQIQNNPRAYLGEITLVGIVGSVGSRDFVLQNDANTFEVIIDYRGSQAFPQVGDKISVEGSLIENRPCCGGGFTLTSTNFELME